MAQADASPADCSEVLDSLKTGVLLAASWALRRGSLEVACRLVQDRGSDAAPSERNDDMCVLERDEAGGGPSDSPCVIAGQKWQLFAAARSERLMGGRLQKGRANLPSVEDCSSWSVAGLHVTRGGIFIGVLSHALSAAQTVEIFITRWRKEGLPEEFASPASPDILSGTVNLSNSSIPLVLCLHELVLSAVLFAESGATISSVSIASSAKFIEMYSTDHREIGPGLWEGSGEYLGTVRCMPSQQHKHQSTPAASSPDESPVSGGLRSDSHGAHSPFAEGQPKWMAGSLDLRASDTTVSGICLKFLGLPAPKSLMHLATLELHGKFSGGASEVTFTTSQGAQLPGSAAPELELARKGWSSGDLLKFSGNSLGLRGLSDEGKIASSQNQMPAMAALFGAALSASRTTGLGAKEGPQLGKLSAGHLGFPKPDLPGALGARPHVGQAGELGQMTQMAAMLQAAMGARGAPGREGGASPQGTDPSLEALAGLLQTGMTMQNSRVPGGTLAGTGVPRLPSSFSSRDASGLQESSFSRQLIEGCSSMQGIQNNGRLNDVGGQLTHPGQQVAVSREPGSDILNEGALLEKLADQEKKLESVLASLSKTSEGLQKQLTDMSQRVARLESRLLPSD